MSDFGSINLKIINNKTLIKKIGDSVRDIIEEYTNDISGNHNDKLPRIDALESDLVDALGTDTTLVYYDVTHIRNDISYLREHLTNSNEMELTVQNYYTYQEFCKVQLTETKENLITPNKASWTVLEECLKELKRRKFYCRKDVENRVQKDIDDYKTFYTSKITEQLTKYYKNFLEDLHNMKLFVDITVSLEYFRDKIMSLDFFLALSK